jgi:hypothetical protein
MTASRSASHLKSTFVLGVGLLFAYSCAGAPKQASESGGSGGSEETGGSTGTGGNASGGSTGTGGKATGGSTGTGGNTGTGGSISPPDASVSGGSGGSSGGSGGTGGRTGGTGGGGSGGSTGGSSGTGGTGAGGTTGSDCGSQPGLTWKTARKTWYTSYPAPGSKECIVYSGCQYQGQFAACAGTKSKAWVQAHNIVAFFPLGNRSLHDICIRAKGKSMIVTVYDTCGDGDCGGCCTKNKGSNDALIDLESFTNQRWGMGDDVPLEWADLGPTKGGGCN